ncbi:putative ABC transporter ATP-binding protein [Caproiciproducens galactitolivorans]|uniref:Putative ABC transporter ATP-binding protein n=1 Tax=Caproiciproducens galactitolivorans TaxID=642589 RepID=A0A4Z0Y8J4_9FIRM|nr:putative ABC transporter ATP-binding protein [Caproiciproducens galactitolivorans]
MGIVIFGKEQRYGKARKVFEAYIAAMLLSILFLSVEAVIDLNLPNMSKIVNVGIQQGGIEQSAPEAVSTKGFSFMQIFMTDAQKKAMEDGYQLVSAKGSAAEKEEYIQKYPLLKTDDIYVRSDFDPQTDHFVRTLSDGYDMILNEEISNVSQGQKQLLTIARVILANPQILILDKATGSVDTRTEILIQKAMDNLMRGRTSFVIVTAFPQSVMRI